MKTCFSCVSPLGEWAELRGRVSAVMSSTVSITSMLHMGTKRREGAERTVCRPPLTPSPFIPTSSSRISIYRHCVPHLQALGRWICTIKRSGRLGEGGRLRGGHIICPLSSDLHRLRS